MTRVRMQSLPMPRQAAGLGLWDSLLLVALIAALLLVAFLSQQANIQQRLAEQQAATVRWADERVAGFVLSHLRLPCPDVDGDGLEDCAAGATAGLLPLLTLGLNADAAVRGPIRIDYNALRPGSRDPAILDSYFEPEKWDGTRYAYGTSNGLDLCQKLVDMVSANAGATLWSLAIPRRDGVPDLVRSHSAARLAHNIGCQTVISSVNGIALGVDVVAEVLSQQQATKQDAILVIAFNVLHIVLAGINVALAAIGLAASITALGVASGLLAGAVASCVVLVGCAFIPIYTAAVTAASVAIGLFGVAIGLGAAAIVALVVSTALAIEVAIKTGNDPGDQTLDIDLSTMEQAAIDAENQATQAEADAAAAYNDMLGAEQNRDDARALVLSLAEAYDPNDDHDALVNSGLGAAVTWAEATVAKNQAQGEYDAAVDRVSDLTGALSYQQDECANASLPEEQYKCDAVSRVQDSLTQAEQDEANKLTAFNAADNQLDAALTDILDAGSDLATAFGINGGTMQFALYSYAVSYRKWLAAVNANTIQQQKAVDARNAATQARQAYEDLKFQYENPGTPPTGSAITVWAGAEAILRQADANGVVE